MLLQFKIGNKARNFRNDIFDIDFIDSTECSKSTKTSSKSTMEIDFVVSTDKYGRLSQHYYRVNADPHKFKIRMRMQKLKKHITRITKEYKQVQLCEQFFPDDNIDINLFDKLKRQDVDCLEQNSAQSTLSSINHEEISANTHAITTYPATELEAVDLQTMRADMTAISDGVQQIQSQLIEYLLSKINNLEEELREARGTCITLGKDIERYTEKRTVTFQKITKEMCTQTREPPLYQNTPEYQKEIKEYKNTVEILGDRVSRLHSYIRGKASVLGLDIARTGDGRRVFVLEPGLRVDVKEYMHTFTGKPVCLDLD